jgi:glutamate N-acetyltransferase / amino-acid N-acetyltransferase
MNLSYDSSVTFPKGFLANGAFVGIKTNGQNDLGLIVSEKPASAAAVFTRNRFQAAPILVSLKHLAVAGSKSRAIVVNSGCANALTGKEGLKAAEKTVVEVAKLIKASAESVLIASTGVIGRQLPVPLIQQAMPALVAGLTAEADNQFAQSIMTTDKFPKQVATEVSLSKKKSFRIGATAKGAGMIHPNMATMLCFVTTDAQIDRKNLATALNFAVARSFNAITVDGDTSTNDTVFVLANGASGTSVKTSAEIKVFSAALTQVLRELAMMIVRDGEGATRFVRLNVENAATYDEAVRVGRAVGTSPLVKTAIFGGDPNWGRVISAVGNTDVKYDPSQIELQVEGISVFRRNEVQKFDMQELDDLFSKREIEMTIRLNAGKASAEVFTCDLSYDYVKINGEYTT